MSEKPRLKLSVIAGRPVTTPIADLRESKIDAARRRFGKLFAHEEGSTWRPHSERVLKAWLADQVKGRK